MHVCLDSIIFGLQRVGGISTYWIELCRHLAHDPNIELHLQMPRNSINDSAADAIALARHVATDNLPTPIGRYLPIPGGRGAIHHSSYYRSPWSPSATSVVTVYDFIYERFRTGYARAAHSWQKRAAIHRANGVICISENTRRDLLERFPDVDAARVIVTPLGVAADRFFAVPLDKIDRALADVVVFVGQRGGYKFVAVGFGGTPPGRDQQLHERQKVD